MMMKQVHDQLIEIRSTRGELTPQAVVDEARNESHPLHNRFEWDDTLAGEAYRRTQAAELIRSVKVIYRETPEGEERSVRAWSSLNTASDDGAAKGYAPTEELVQDDFSRKLLLRQLERDVKALQRKYGHMEEFAQIISGAAGDGAA